MMAQYAILLLLAFVAFGCGSQEIDQVADSYGIPITGNTRPTQDCPINSDLLFRRCLSPCQSTTCADLRKESRGGTQPCVRMCVSGWACPQGQYLLDGYTDVCVKKKACKKLKKKRTAECSFEGNIIPMNTNFLRGSETCRCFVDGEVRCRNAFPEA